MKIVTVGGGPAGLYFSLLMKKQQPRHEITVIERNRPDDTFGWGVVFSGETLEHFAAADAESHAAIRDSFAYWQDIDIFFKGERVRSSGHSFCGLSRKRLLNILQERCRQVGVRLEFQCEVDDLVGFADADLVLAADGANSKLRDLHAGSFRPTIEWGRCRFSWLGTDLRYDAFTFIFKETEFGLFQVHAYPFDDKTSTFIVECHEDVWRRAGLDRADEAETVRLLGELFREDLRGHRLLANRSLWRAFPTIRCGSWRHEKLILLGDSAHTAHFSIGSGTKLAMEDAIALERAFASHGGDDVPRALAAYEAARLGEVARLQRAARVSREWFENSARYLGLQPLQFAFSLLSRSRRITYDNLRLRDPELVERVSAHFALTNPHRDAAPQTAVGGSAPPLFQPFRLRGLRLANRVVVSPMCQYSSEDGMPDDWHLVHLGSRAVGGAGLVFTEATHVSREGRITPGCAGLYKPEHVPAWRRVVDFVHGHSGARIGMQLAHAGRKGSCSLPWQGDRPLERGGWELLAPSPLPYAPGWPVPRAMTPADMDAVTRQFVRAAQMADEAGFDVLELHMAHGYLLGTFISPLTNQRTDEHGGSIENRMRYPLAVFAAVRAVWPAEKPISVRISGTDWKDGGLSSADRVGLARLLKAGGCDVIAVSGGQTVSDQEPLYGRMYQVPFSEEIRLEAGIPTMTVGNVQDADQCNTILAAQRADLCVLARAHLSDPYLTLRAAAAYGYDAQPWPPQYLPAKPAGRKA